MREKSLKVTQAMAPGGAVEERRRREAVVGVDVLPVEGIVGARVREVGEGFLEPPLGPLVLRGRHLVSLAGEQLEGCLQALAVLERALEVEGRRLASVGVGARVAGGVLVEALGERECLLGLVEVAAEVVADTVPGRAPRAPAGAVVHLRLVDCSRRARRRQSRLALG